MSSSRQPPNTDSLPTIDAVSTSVCCPGLIKAMLGAMAMVTAVALIAAGFWLGQYRQAVRQTESLVTNSTVTSTTTAEHPFGERILKANGAVSSEKFSMTTGFISEEAEGVFVLDHNSGLLQCSVIYPRRGVFGALYTVNVREGLGAAGKGSGSGPRGAATGRSGSGGGGGFLMVTGRADFPRASNRPIASTVVYVMDTSTGNYAGYAVPFDRVAVSAGRPQQGTMQLIATGTANPVIDRDALR